MTAAIYARVSTEDQDCSLQLAELRAVAQRNGWDAVEYIEKASGKADTKRPVLERLFTDAREQKFGAVLVWKLDRFGRSLHHLIVNIQTLDELGIRFIASTQGIDTDNHSPSGRLLLHIMGAFAEFERALIVERVRAGMRAAKCQGRKMGRPKRVFDRLRALEMRESGASVRQIAKAFEVGTGTVQRLLGACQKPGLTPPAPVA
jgi:DNA invertase Pin-like site-specific DNA recombinase